MKRRALLKDIIAGGAAMAPMIFSVVSIRSRREK